MAKNNICLIYNFAQHYRTNIFTLLDEELHCDFVFGNSLGDIKKMDYTLLTNFKKEVENKVFLRRPLYYQKGVIKLLREDYSIFLILGETICVSTWLMLFLSKIYRKKIYFWSHGWYGKESFIRRIMKKIFFSMADGTFLYGNYAKELMTKEGLNSDKLHVIYNSLDYDRQIAIREKLKTKNIYIDHFRNNHDNIVFIGRLTPVKKLDLLIKALAKLTDHNFHVNLTLIGDGEKSDKLNEMTKTLDLSDKVWFYGACYDEIILSELIYNADLCVSPGNVGLTAMHSMVYGTPVLTHNNFQYQMPEFEAIEDGVTGAFFEYGNVDSLAETIKRWFEVAPDREFVRKRCYEVIDTRYNPHIQLEVFKKILLEKY